MITEEHYFSSTAQADLQLWVSLPTHSASDIELSQLGLKTPECWDSTECNFIDPAYSHSYRGAKAIILVRVKVN